MSDYEFIQWYMAQCKKEHVTRTVGQVIRAWEQWKALGRMTPAKIRFN